MRSAALLFVCLLAAAVPAWGDEFVVSAAASLTNAFRDIGRAYEAEHPGTTVAFNFAASDILLAQIAKGAPADVFAAADQATMDRASRDGLVTSATRRDFAANALVLIVPAGAESVSGLSALTTPRFGHIAMGSPQTVPAGRYAKEALEGAGLWTSLEAKFVFAQNVRQVLDYVAREEADAGFVYATDAAIAPGKVKPVLDVATVTPVRYPIAVVKESRHATLAGAFVEFVAGAQGQLILARYGFRGA